MNKLSGTQKALALGGYAVGINAAAVGLFYYDKQQALQKEWRVREDTLHLMALLGGWIGSWWAIDRFRHKSSKKSFQQTHALATAGNLAIVGGGYAAYKRMRPQEFFQHLQQILTQFGKRGRRGRRY